MQRRLLATMLIGSFIGCALGLAACSDDTKKTNRDKGRTTYRDGSASDQGPLPDTGTADIGQGGDYWPSADKPKTGDKNLTVDQPKTGDKGPAGDVNKTDGPIIAGCDPSCTAQNRVLCVKDGTGTCRSCNTSADCAANPFAYGPTCDTTQHVCSCASSTECAGNGNGELCSTDYNICYCAANSDCKKPGYSICDREQWWCMPPCKTDADCAGNNFNRVCNASSGQCVRCLKDTDCNAASGMPYCSSSFACVDCKLDTDCSKSLYGSKCRPDIGCGCAGNTDCAGPAFGGECDTTRGYCGCTGATGCTSSPRGPTCDTDNAVCTCSLDTECTKTGYTKCSQAFGTSTLTWCNPSCSGDAQCTALAWQDLYRCDTGSSKCVGCKASTDCAPETWAKTCDTATSSCVGCLSSTDCTTASLGNQCNTTYQMCACASSTDCSANLNGKYCDSYLYMCSCRSDSDCISPRKCTGYNPYSYAGYYMMACE